MLVDFVFCPSEPKSKNQPSLIPMWFFCLFIFKKCHFTAIDVWKWDGNTNPDKLKVRITEYFIFFILGAFLFLIKLLCGWKKSNSAKS